MRVSMTTRGARLDLMVRSLVLQRITGDLERFSASIEKVAIEMEDVPGTRGRFKRCGLRLVLRDGDEIEAAHSAEGTLTAAAGAVDRVTREFAESPEATAPGALRGARGWPC
jgi:hypothetical protein